MANPALQLTNASVASFPLAFAAERQCRWAASDHRGETHSPGIRGRASRNAAGLVACLRASRKLERR
jgi:hypothetical protein